jgi:cellulose synthase/poly-beta-1,6-N-acetylglucosamine synthase-like glycosyltransferase
LGAQESSADVVLFLDADVEVRPDIVARVSQAFVQDPQLAALFGSYDDAPAATNFLSQYKNLLHHYVHQTAREEAFTFWTGCGAIRREVFLSLGGLDERYTRPAIEDIELGYRLRGAGHRVVLLKDLQVKHLKPWLAVQLVHTDFVRRALPWSELILRHRQFNNDLNIAWTSRLSGLAVGVLVASVAAAFFAPASLAVAGVSAVALLLLNAPFYRFLWRKRGALFMLRAIPFHWFYYLYSGVAFVVALIRHLVHGMRSHRVAGHPGRAKSDRRAAVDPNPGQTTQ